MNLPFHMNIKQFFNWHYNLLHLNLDFNLDLKLVFYTNRIVKQNSLHLDQLSKKKHNFSYERFV